MTDDLQTADEDVEAFDVVIDANFVRATADKIFPIFLGRDFELIAVQFAPRVTDISQNADAEEQVNFQPTYYELCRIRTSAREMTKVVINALEALIGADVIKTQALINKMQDWEKAKDGLEDEANVV